MAALLADFYLDKVRDLYGIYEKVKLTIIYAENFDPKHELYIAPINQLRSALDHIFKASKAESEEDCEYELKEAKEHLDRAGYDAFEVLAANLGMLILEKVKGYSTEIITNVFPEYFTIVSPKLNEIKKILSGIRQSKKNSVNGNNDSFTKYFSQIEELFSINTKVDLLIPSLEEFKEKRNKEEEAKNKKEKRKKRNEFLFNAIIVGVLSAVVSGLLVYFATTYFGNHKNEQKPNNSAVIDTAKKY